MKEFMHVGVPTTVAREGEIYKTKVRPAVGRNTTSENADKILLTTDYSKKSFRWHEADVGPFVSL